MSGVRGEGGGGGGGYVGHILMVGRKGGGVRLVRLGALDHRVPSYTVLRPANLREEWMKEDICDC